MKTARLITALTISLILVFGTSIMAKKPRKLPIGAYIKTAKIEILSGDPQRYPLAIAMLDSLAIYYGPHAEALSLMGMIMVDAIETTPDLKAKRPLVDKLVAYTDSLKQCCENKEIKRKNRKGCNKFVEKSDSTTVKFWREYYNAGIEQLGEVEELIEQKKQETDSESVAFIDQSLTAYLDSCLANLELAVTLDPLESKAFIAMGNAYERQEKYEEAIAWLEKGLEGSDERNVTALQAIAYDYINMNDYCGAIPYFKEVYEQMPDEVSLMFNLTICYNNCKMYDSAVVFYHAMLEVEPDNSDAITGIGRFFNQQARWASDSASAYKEAGDEAQDKAWRDKRQELFDSSGVYFKHAFDLLLEDEFVASEYGRITYLSGDFEQSAIAFKRLTGIRPQEDDYWVTLGDCYLQLQRFPEAIAAYEGALQIEPDARDILENLKDLYHNERNAKKEAEIVERLKKL